MRGSAAPIHSVRAVPRDQLRHHRRGARSPLHVHLSEQVGGERRVPARRTALTPTQVLRRGRPPRTADNTPSTPPTSPTTTSRCSARRGTYVCFCPTTERDLGDGIGPSRALHDAGSPADAGQSDSHAVIDLVRGDARRRARRAARHPAARPLDRGRAARRPAPATTPSAGTTPVAIAVGRRADLVTIAHRPRAHGRAPAPTSRPRSSRPSPRTSPTSWSTAGSSSAQGDREQLGRDLAAVIDRIWENA